MFMRDRGNAERTITVCVGKGISLLPEPKFPRAVASRLIERALWMNRKVAQFADYFDDVVTTIRTLMGPIPHEPFWPALNTIARVEAELVNSQRRFLDEFQSLALEAGHSYEFRLLDGKSEFVVPTYTKDAVTDSDFVYQATEFQSLIDREKISEASSEDKHKLAVYRYMSYWHVKWADTPFVENHPISLEDKARSLLRCLVGHSVQYRGNNFDKKNETLVAAGMLYEVMMILGFKHIFDTNTIINTNRISDGIMDQIKRCELFVSYGEACRLFGFEEKNSVKATQKRTNKYEWSRKDVLHCIGIALRRCNLDLVTTRKYATINSKREAYNMYQLSKESVEKASEMSLLSVEQQFGRKWSDEVNDTVRPFLLAVEMNGYKHYAKYLIVREPKVKVEAETTVENTASLLDTLQIEDE